MILINAYVPLRSSSAPVRNYMLTYIKKLRCVMAEQPQKSKPYFLDGI
jgi:hypothetical protein